MMAPFDKLKSLTNAENHLKTGFSFEILNRVILEMSDIQATDQLQQARQKLFNSIHEQALKSG